MLLGCFRTCLGEWALASLALWLPKAIGRPLPPVGLGGQFPEELARLVESSNGNLHEILQQHAGLSDLQTVGLSSHDWHGHSPLGNHYGHENSLPALPSTYSTHPVYPDAYLDLPHAYGSTHAPSHPLNQHFSAVPRSIQGPSVSQSLHLERPDFPDAAGASNSHIYTVRPDVLLDHGIWVDREVQSPRFEVSAMAHTPSPLRNPQTPPQDEQLLRSTDISEAHPLSPEPEHVPSEGGSQSSQRPYSGSHSYRNIEDIGPVWNRASHGFRYLPGRHYVVIQPDPEIDALVTKIRSRGLEYGSMLDISNPLLLQKPVELLREFERIPNRVAVRVFWTSVQTKEVAFNGRNGQRRLMLSFSARPNFVAQRTGAGLLGVWEFGPIQRDGFAAIYLRGFYQFSPDEFIKLERNPEATGKKTWVVIRESTSQLDPDQYLRVSVKSSTGSDSLTEVGLPKVVKRPGSGLRSVPDTLHGSGFGRPVPGKYLYNYRESLQVSLLTQEWKREANLDSHSFYPIELTDEQKRHLSPKVAQTFRQPRPVKMIDLADGDSLMLVYHTRATWLGPHRSNTVSIWRFGAEVGQQRLLTAVGFFYLQPTMWRKLTSKTIKGLRLSTFHYNDLNMP